MNRQREDVEQCGHREKMFDEAAKSRQQLREPVSGRFDADCMGCVGVGKDVGSPTKSQRAFAVLVILGIVIAHIIPITLFDDKDPTVAREKQTREQIISDVLG